VRDATGAVVEKCAVKLQNVSQATASTAATDGAGNFEFPDVRVGTYNLQVRCTGFKVAVTETFAVAVNARQRVDLVMEVGEVTDSVTVTGAASLVESESSDRGQVIGSEPVVDLPLNGRNYADLALLVPGIRKSGLSSSEEASFDANGLRAHFNNFMLDGVDNNSYATSHQGYSSEVVVPPPDAIQEFKLQTDNYSAEFGRAGGAAVNVTLRSGSNEFHGTAWEFLRNTSLNAIGFFKPAGNSKPVLIQNQFGGGIGGPIRKNKMFFFADYEGFRQVTRQLTFASLPTLDQRIGIFTVPVKNPYGNQMYPNEAIPASVIIPFAQKVFGDLPAPNLPGIANNYEWLPRATNQSDKGDIRYDHYASNSVTLFGRYSQRLAYLLTPGSVPGPSGGDGLNTKIAYKQAALGATWTLSPSALLDWRLAITKGDGGKYPVDLGKPDMADAYGISGLPSDPSVVGGLNSQYITGYAKMGRDNSSPQYQNPLVIDPKVNFSRIFRRHTLKAGYEYQLINTAVDDFNPVVGQDTYGGQFSNSGSGSNSVYNIADFLVGARSNYLLNNVNVANLRQRMHFGYIQDDFRATSRLTFNLGVRYEFATPQWERDNKLSNYDPTTNSIVRGSSGSIYDRALVNPDLKDFAPRLGFAYRLGPKTAIRSGYGISYIHFNRSGGENLLAYNGPSIVQASINQIPSQGLCTNDLTPATCFRPTNMGYPANFVSPSNFNPIQARVIYMPANFRAPYVQTWHFTVQREIKNDLLIDVAYVGNHSVGLLEYADYNQAVPNQAGQTLTLQQRRPIQSFSYIQMAFNGGFGGYNGLQVKLEKRYASGFYLLNSFSWSKAIDNGGGNQEDGAGDNENENLHNLRMNRGLSGYNQPFNNTTTLLWQAPTGKNWGSAVKAALGGWNISAINTMTSGLPINLIYNPNAYMIVSSFPSGDTTRYRVNVTGNPLMPASERTIYSYFNPATVQVPTDISQPFGNAGRNIVSGYPFYELDLGARKQFALPGETKRLEFRAEAFNLLNHTNFNAPDGNRSDSTFGVVASTLPGRQIQLALKFLF